ncbi:Asp23/Gls24 family envelope stress response protein [Aminobacterium colombiense]|jgi:uncharacterized alkaline shock family protein YloU|nr:Asp23/Gls24 family envelope stress response protein [Aminobacterium colombiense]MDD2379963.1 hypothetical protein [Aminobacterium colombiense]NLK29615.1 Asp23/Gls24 family envelope stress response protein [Aminobacterium colombiense]
MNKLDSTTARNSLQMIHVIAFVGPAGTGKSQRAQYVATDNNVDYIIDDGLVIARGRIMTGKSAKSEKNLVRAIRRALFEFPEHREEVVSFLEKQAPCTVMIIATSTAMALKIVRILNLPQPERFIHIGDVASAEDIKSARKERLTKGQHVIPVSRAQIRRNFAGKLVGHLRDLFKTVDKEEGERTIVRPPFNFYGELSIEPQAIIDIVRYLTERTGQVRAIQDIKVRPIDDAIEITVTVTLSLGAVTFRTIGERIRWKSAKAVRYFTGMDIREVNVLINGVFIE